MATTTEKTLTCQVCSDSFPFSVEEQLFYESKGFQEPKKCKPCRQAAKAGGNRPSYNAPQRQMYEVPCAGCGQTASVPFLPRGDRPVFCRACYADTMPAR
jgi:CxxC-x17-CxxC domain-containing protein